MSFLLSIMTLKISWFLFQYRLHSWATVGVDTWRNIYAAMPVSNMKEAWFTENGIYVNLSSTIRLELIMNEIPIENNFIKTIYEKPFI